MTLQITVNPPSPLPLAAGDLNGDGKINVQDAILILLKTVGL